MTPSALRSLLAEHQKFRPDSLAATHPSASLRLRKRWEEWCARKFELQQKLEIAIAMEGATWKAPAGESLQGPIRWGSEKEQRPSLDKCGSEHYLRKLQVSLASMAKLMPGSVEWEQERNRAACYHLHGRRRAQSEGSDVVFPVIPTYEDLDPEGAREKRLAQRRASQQKKEKR